MRTGELTKQGISAYIKGGDGGDKYKNIVVVGTSTNGHTAEEVDYLCDGVDDQVEINQAIQDAPPNTTIFILSGKYITREEITIDKDDIYIKGTLDVPGYIDNNSDSNSTYIFGQYFFGDVNTIFNITNCSRINISGMRIHRSSSHNNIVFNGIVSDVSIENNIIQNTGGSFSSKFFSIYGEVQSIDNEINNINIINNCFISESEYTIYFKGISTNYINNIHIADNSFYGVNAYIIGAVHMQYVDGISVLGSFIESSIDIVNCENIDIRKNRIQRNGSAKYDRCIYIQSANNISIDDNLINVEKDETESKYTSNGANGIYVSDSTGLSIVSNIVAYAGHGLRINNCSNHRILSNIIKYTSSGIYLSGITSSNNISNNIIINSSVHGIFCSNSINDSIVSGNLVSFSSTSTSTNYQADLLYVSSTSRANIINNLLAFDSTYSLPYLYSLRISGCRYCNIINNHIYGKNYTLSGGIGNIFVDNKYQ